MRVLVTGSSGFIGGYVTAELEYKGHEFVGFDQPNHDVRDASNLFVEARYYSVDAIINLAGILGTPELFGYEYKAAEINVMGAINVYDVAEKMGIPVVQIGTGHKGQPNPYAITKGCAEDIGLARARYSHEKIAIVRAFHAYGAGQAVGPPHGTAHVNKFFPTFACRALTGLPLHLCGGGDQLIDPVHVTDVAKEIVAAIEGPYGDVLEAGCGVPFTVARIAADIHRVATDDNSLPDFCLTEARRGEPENAEVVASAPTSRNVWPYKIHETVEWYRQWLQRSQ